VEVKEYHCVSILIAATVTNPATITNPATFTIAAVAGAIDGVFFYFLIMLFRILMFD